MRFGSQKRAPASSRSISAIRSTVSAIRWPHEDLDETVNVVEKTGRRIVAERGDVRDFERLKTIAANGVAELGRVDFVIANAGIAPLVGEQRHDIVAYVDAVDVMLNGVYYTIEATLPALLDHGDGGAIVITSSTAGLNSLCPRSAFEATVSRTITPPSMASSGSCGTTRPRWPRRTSASTQCTRPASPRRGSSMSPPRSRGGGMTQREYGGFMTERQQQGSRTLSRFWSFLAPAYDVRYLKRWIYLPAQDEMIALLNTTESLTVVADIGRGTGILADRIEHETQATEVYGVGLSKGRFLRSFSMPLAYRGPRGRRGGAFGRAKGTRPVEGRRWRSDRWRPINHRLGIV
jgi:hypothetical protein